MKSCFILVFLISCSSFGQTHSLQYYIQQAKQNSPLLKDYQNQIRSAHLDSLILRASLKTQVNFISTNSYAPIVHGYGYDEAITNKFNISSLVQATRNFFTPGNIAAQLAAIRFQAQALSDTIKISEQDLARAITEQYITAYGELVAVDFNNEILELLRKEDTVLKRLAQQSVYKQTDYLSFYVTLQQQQFAVSQAQIQYNTDFLMLNFLTGVVDTTVERIERPNLNDTMNFDFYRSVFYQRFVTDSLRLASEKELINYSYRPRIGAYSDAGYVSSLLDNPAKNFGFSVGVSLAVPIYDGHQRTYRMRQLDLKENSRVVNRDFFVNQYRQQIAMLNQQLHASDTLVKGIEEQIRYVRTLISANARLLETGDIKISDYVLALTNYVNARNVLTQNYITRLRIVNQINYWNR